MTSLAAIHTGKKALALDDDTYRAMLARVTGKQSAKELTAFECRRVIDEMRRQGFKPVSKGTQKPLEGRYAKKLQALWIAGWNLGLVRDRTDKALIAFVQRQTGIDHIRFVCHADDAAKAIEALKSWLSRAGGVDWKNINGTAEYQQSVGYRIAMAQWCRLYGHNAKKLNNFAKGIATLWHKPITEMNDADWIGIMNWLGREIRKATKDGRL